MGILQTSIITMTEIANPIYDFRSKSCLPRPNKQILPVMNTHTKRAKSKISCQSQDVPPYRPRLRARRRCAGQKAVSLTVLANAAREKKIQAHASDTSPSKHHLRKSPRKRVKRAKLPKLDLDLEDIYCRKGAH